MTQKMLEGASENGERVHVSIGTFSGYAGVAEVRGQLTIAYQHGVRPEAGTQIDIEGTAYTVLSSAYGERVPGFVTAAIRET